MKQPYVPPEFDVTAFNCPHCHAFASQAWFELAGKGSLDRNYRTLGFEMHVSVCVHCHRPAIWSAFALVYPITLLAEPPNEDLPSDIKNDYDEARAIFSLSPRGASALLRLAIQKLCKHLGKKGKSIDDDIKELVADGLPVKVQKAMDAVRVIGNNAVHPGTMGLRDNREIANKLFTLVNIVAHAMITQPREVDEVFETLPEPAKDAIEKRDNPPSKGTAI